MSELKSRYEYGLKSDQFPRFPISFEVDSFIEVFQDGHTCIMSTETRKKLAVFNSDELAFLVQVPCVVEAKEEEIKVDYDDPIIREYWTLKDLGKFSAIFGVSFLVGYIIYNLLA